VPSPIPAPTPLPTTASVSMPFAVPRPTYPAARPLGLIAVALAYFALGVAVGLVMKRTGTPRRWLGVVIAPATLAAIAYVLWVARTLL
jgi:hypothetical protein